MLKLSQLPDIFRGSLYDVLIENEPETDIELPKNIKVDLKFDNLGDILRTIDTCIYLGCDFPFAILDYAETNSDKILNEIQEFVAGETYPEYQIFVTTPEFQAVKIIVEIENYYITQFSQFDASFIKHDSVILIKYIESKCNTWYLRTNLVISICTNGAINILKYCSKYDWFIQHIKDVEFSCNMCAKASCRGNIKVLRYLREVLKAEWDETTLDYNLTDWISSTNTKEKTECFRYAIENGCPIGKYSMKKAIAMGRLEEIKMLFERGCILEQNYLYSCCAKGYFEVVQFLEKNGCIWEPEEAALYGLSAGFYNGVN